MSSLDLVSQNEEELELDLDSRSKMLIRFEMTEIMNPKVSKS